MFRAVIQTIFTKTRYTGSYLDGEYHGHGDLRLASKHYQGEFVNGVYHGKGLLEDYELRSTYIGEFY